LPLKADNIWYTYTGDKWVLRGITLILERRRLVAVTGPNASGKTTLLKILGGLYKPAKGNVTVDGVPLWPPTERARGARLRVVYVHDKPIIVKGTTLYNAALGLLIRGVPQEEAYPRAIRALELLGLEKLVETPARELSAGQRQLLSIARALAVEPAYLLLDEPTSNLDRPKKKMLTSILLEKAGEGMGVALASHDAALIQVAQEEYELNEGRITRIH